MFNPGLVSHELKVNEAQARGLSLRKRASVVIVLAHYVAESPKPLLLCKPRIIFPFKSNTSTIVFDIVTANRQQWKANQVHRFTIGHSEWLPGKSEHSLHSFLSLRLLIT